MAAGLKTLDLRVGTPMQVGCVYQAIASGLQVPIRVVSATPFSTFSKVYTDVVDRGALLELFPAALQKAYDITVDSQASAAQLFNAIRRRTPTAAALTLYELELVDSALHKSSHSFATEAVASYISTLRAAGACDPSLINDALCTQPSAAPTHVATPNQCVSLVVCQRIDGQPHVLCRSSGSNLELPYEQSVPWDRASALAAASRLALTVLGSTPATWQHKPPTLISRTIPGSNLSAVSIGAFSLPLPLAEGLWTWVPSSRYMARSNAADALIADAVRAWVKIPSTRRTPQMAQPSSRQPRHRSGKSRSPESLTKLGRAAEATAASGREAAQATTSLHRRDAKPVPPHLSTLPEYIVEWHRTMQRTTPTKLPLVAAATTTRQAKPIKWPDVTNLHPETTSNELAKVNALIAATMVEYHQRADKPLELGTDVKLLSEIIAASRDRAKGRGSTKITPRDVAEAARTMDPARSYPESPAMAIPEHYDRMMSELSSARALVDSQVQKGSRRPKVLVAGERHSVVAKMFREAGADVATSDLQPTDTPSIPHHRGDMTHVLDLGWDLVIGHPPCTYLANVSSPALAKDDSRVVDMNHSADLFRRIYHADAPFVAVENPVMHSRGRRRTACGPPDQYIQPYQHGTGHQKKTGLHLRGLPPLLPTCEVDGRERPMANLPDVPQRSDLRSRTYLGIAGAMALQWMPTLMNYLQVNQNPSDTPPEPSVESAHSLIQKTRSASISKKGQVWFTRTMPDGREQIAMPFSGTPTLCETDLPDDADAADAHAISAAVSAAELPSEWISEAKDAAQLYPYGHHRATDFVDQCLVDTYLWVVPLDPQAATSPKGVTWVGVDRALSKLSVTSAVMSRSVARLVGERMSDDSIARASMPSPSVQAVEAFPAPRTSWSTPPSFKPWLRPPPSARLTIPPLPVSKIHYNRHRWRAWQAIENTSPPLYAWQPIPETLNQALSSQYRPLNPRTLMTCGEESCADLEEPPVLTVAHATPADSTQRTEDLGSSDHPDNDATGSTLGTPPAFPPTNPAAALKTPRSSGVLYHHDRSHRANLEKSWEESERRAASFNPGGEPWTQEPRLGLGANPDDPPRRRPKLPRNCSARRIAIKLGTTWVRDPQFDDEVSRGTDLGPSRGHSSKIWFAHRHPTRGVQLLSYCRADAPLDLSQRDTFGGHVAEADAGSYHACLRRTLAESCEVPPPWTAAIEMTLADGTDRQLVKLDPRRDHDGKEHHTACYVAWIDNMFELPTLTRTGRRCSEPESLSWLDASEVVTNLRQFRSTSPVGDALESLLALNPTATTVAAIPFSTSNADDPSRPLTEAKLTPATRNYHQCLYTQGITVCRRKGNDRFWIDCALTDAHRTLADTGAAPSILTTGLLAKLPKDALVTRDHHAVNFRVNGPDGQPLVTRGHATITFAIDEHAYQHRFMVVEGDPLMILGQDFLAPWKARLNLNENDDGRGRMELDGRTVRVTSNAADLTSSVNSVDANRPGGPPAPDDATAPTAPCREATGHAKPIHISPELKGLAPAEVALKRLSYSEGSYVLYSAHQAIVVPPMTQLRVYLQAPDEVVQRGDHGIVAPPPFEAAAQPHHPHVEVAAVNPDADGKVPVTLWNATRRQMVIPAFSAVATLSTEYQIQDSGAPTGGAPRTYAELSPELKAIIDKITLDKQERLQPWQRTMALDLLAEFADVFALDPKSPKHTHLMEVMLELKPGSQPHRHAPSRLGPEGQKIVDEHIDEMESRNIIRKSNSSWASRVVLVTKKDGSIRFCVDFRDVNSKLQIMDSPIPLTAEAIDRLASGKGDPSSLFLSTMDLASGFWTLPIRESDKSLLAFVTHRGKYEFNYLPFGVQSGPSYMCRLMDAALQGLAWDICMPYLDDTAAWSTGIGDTPEDRELSSFHQMMERLRLIFERFRWAQLSCKPSKCEFFSTSAEYLGHIVSRKGLEMDPKKIRTLSELDTTQINDIGKVRSFLGLASYYRRFVKKFAEIAAPLHDLTLDGVDVAHESQTPTAQEAMRALIAALVSEPVLTMPRFDREFIVKTDAAVTEGLGGVLSQHNDDHKECVNAYYGRRLRKAERNWTVTEVELLAAIESIRNWRPYLWGRKFRLVIDHSALRWLHTMRDTFEGGSASRLMRWIMKLQEYNFTVEHKPGINHGDADGVSRLAQRVAAISAETQSEDPTRPDYRNTVGVCAAIRAELDEWASERRPGETKYCDARSAAVDHYWHQTDPMVAAVRKPTTTARRVQDEQRRERNLTESRENIIKYYLATDAPTQHQLRQMQQLDADCRYLTDYLVTGSAGAPATREDWRRVRWALREIRHLELHDGILYRRDPVPDSTNDRLRVYVPAEARSAMMAAFHEHFGHQSLVPMRRALKLRHYWPGMDRDIHDHIGECHECTLGGRLRLKYRRPKGPKMGHYPFDLLYVDVLDMAKTHDYVPNESGYSKLLVFVDSLTRWVEAIPFHGDPTSEQVLDAFMTHIVARHGCPRYLRSDLGSNFASDLCTTILEQTGCNLAPSTAAHHESVGTVERFNGTISQMIRIADEGGLHWTDHLPFLLLSYRATPHRVTQLSPAALLYGRELRMPAQMDRPDTESLRVQNANSSEEIQNYAENLHNACVWAWHAATEATLAEQSLAVSKDQSRSYRYQYEAGDRVARLLPDNANKLKYLWSGPYRIAEVLPDGNCRLRDLENNILHDEFEPSHLRPYRATVDAEELAADEYVIDRLDGHRDRRGQREYRIKWRGFPMSQSTWEPRSEIERRAAALVEAYEQRLQPAADEQPKRHNRKRRASAAPAPVPVPAPAPAPMPHYESDDAPTIAKFERGSWMYGMHRATARGRRLHWYPVSNFTANQRQSDAFEALRATHLAALDVKAAAVVAAALTMCE